MWLYDEALVLNRTRQAAGARPARRFTYRFPHQHPAVVSPTAGARMGVPDGLRAALADRYTLERELGAGGMATVYLAHDLRHDRKVALKLLREELSASLGKERFLREIKVAAALQHPHILPLYDSGGRRPAILRHAVRRRPVAP